MTLDIFRVCACYLYIHFEQFLGRAFLSLFHINSVLAPNLWDIIFNNLSRNRKKYVHTQARDGGSPKTKDSQQALNLMKLEAPDYKWTGSPFSCK